MRTDNEDSMQCINADAGKDSDADADTGTDADADADANAHADAVLVLVLVLLVIREKEKLLGIAVDPPKLTITHNKTELLTTLRAAIMTVPAP